jgi:hypothetical protein
LGYFPNGDEWAFVEIDRTDERIHCAIRQQYQRRMQ